jgi:hypothetical protein
MGTGRVRNACRGAGSGLLPRKKEKRDIKDDEDWHGNGESIGHITSSSSFNLVLLPEGRIEKDRKTKYGTRDPQSSESHELTFR